jgi:hypothetical protein
MNGRGAFHGSKIAATCAKGERRAKIFTHENARSVIMQTILLAIAAGFPHIQLSSPMKMKVLLTVLAALSLGFSTSLCADEDTPLNKQMTAMNKSLRTLKRQISDAAKKDDNLALVGKMKANVAEAIKLEPKKTKDVPAAEKAAYVEKFKQELTELGKTYDQLEALIKDGKNAEAKAVFDKISEQKEKGHKDFGVDEE